MKANLHSKRKMLVFILAFAILMATVTAVVVSADPEIKVVGEMVDIKSKFSDYLVQDTVITEDSFVGTLQYTVYYDKTKGEAVPGYHGTPVIIYTVNHPEIERVGTDSNETIISSMLERGYIVIVLDYLENKKAISPNIENSSQSFRSDVLNGKILKNTTDIPKGEYREALRYCGTKSGRDGDKFAATGLTVEKTAEGTPYPAEANLVLVCRKLYQSTLKEEGFHDRSILADHYPNRDLHDMYIGEILKVLVNE